MGSSTCTSLSADPEEGKISFSLHCVRPGEEHLVTKIVFAETISPAMRTTQQRRRFKNTFTSTESLLITLTLPGMRVNAIWLHKLRPTRGSLYCFQIRFEGNSSNAWNRRKAHGPQYKVLTAVAVDLVSVDFVHCQCH